MQFVEVVTASTTAWQNQTTNYFVFFSWYTGSSGTISITDPSANAISGSISSMAGTNNPLIIPPNYTITPTAGMALYGFILTLQELANALIGNS